jgi:hypothetical protein
LPEHEADRGVAELVGIECGVVSGVINLESSGVEAPDWNHAMTRFTKPDSWQPTVEMDNWFDPIETEVVNEGQLLEYEEVSNRGRTSWKILKPSAEDRSYQSRRLVGRN